MILRFGNTIYDLKYCEKIELVKHFLYMRFLNGREEVIDLREFDCDHKELFEQIYNDKTDDNVMLQVDPKDDKEKLDEFEKMSRELGLM
jgi:hypothetical protein